MQAGACPENCFAASENAGFVVKKPNQRIMNQEVQIYAATTLRFSSYSALAFSQV